MTASPEATKAAKTSAMIAKCRDSACGYAWIIAFLPMDALHAAKLGIKCGCPMCGDGRPMLGQQADLDPTLQAHLQAMMDIQP